MQQIATDVWRIDGGQVPFLGMALPTSSTVIRLPDGSLVLYSPPAFDDATAAALDALGEVAHIVAPNVFHHLFAVAAAARWPRATVHAAPGVAKKQRELRIGREFEIGATAPWGPAIAAELIAGAPRVNEVVLFHHASGTLVCADLVFHIPRAPSWGTRLGLWLDGAGGGRLAQGRTWRLLRTDRRAARESAERMLAWPIARVAPCHGDPVELDAAGFAPHLTRLCGGRVAAPSDPRPAASSDAR